MRQCIRSALVQIMACRRFGAKPLSKPMLGYWILSYKIQWNFNQNTNLFTHENASEIIVCEMAAILSRVDRLNTCIQQAMRSGISPVNSSVIGSPQSSLVYRSLDSNYHQAGKTFMRKRPINNEWIRITDVFSAGLHSPRGMQFQVRDWKGMVDLDLGSEQKIRGLILSHNDVTLVPWRLKSSVTQLTAC